MNTPRCDCRYPVPNDFADPASADAQKFSWNVKFGAGCQGTKTTAGRWGVLKNGDDGTRDNTPASWKTRIATTYPYPGLPSYLTSASYTSQVSLPPDSVSRCCRVVTSPSAQFRREDPRLMNLWVRDPTNGSLLPGRVNPLPATTALARTTWA